MIDSKMFCIRRKEMEKASIFLVLMTLIPGFLAWNVVAEERNKTPNVFLHEAFNVVIPTGWIVVQNPEPGVEIGLKHEKIRSAKWYLHYETMPSYVREPSSDDPSLRGIADQFDNLVQQQFPGAKKLSPQKRELPDNILLHLLYELREDHIPVKREYVYLIAHQTAYVIQSTVPKGREDEVSQAIEMIFRTFRPRRWSEDAPFTADQALENLRENLPKLAASIPADWRPIIKEIKFLADTPHKGNLSLSILTQWPRRELKREFTSTKEAIASLQSDDSEAAAVTWESVGLVTYIGQLLGLTVGEVYGLEAPATHLIVCLLDYSGLRAGVVTIRTEDLVRIMSGGIELDEAACLYQFE